MNDSYDKELTTLFSGDSDALADDAFVDRCVESIRRAHRRLLILKLIGTCAAVGIVGLVSSPLTRLAAGVPYSLFAMFASLDNAIGGIGRVTVVGVVLVLIVRRYGFPSFRLR